MKRLTETEVAIIASRIVYLTLHTHLGCPTRFQIMMIAKILTGPLRTKSDTERLIKAALSLTKESMIDLPFDPD